MELNMKCLVCLLILVSSVFCFGEDLVASRRFNIKPDPSAKSTDIVWGDIKCTFTYQAMGGTNEDWEIGIIHADEHQVTCMVNRADKMTTYLVFQSFSLKVKGAEFAVGQPYDRSNEALLPTEFVELPKKNMVKNSKNFKNEIGKVTLWAKFGEEKEEL
ncbi:myeloid-derived growth factor homolog [Pecten maximus]|uniref:myeloid-derived growth factor homolog n=1 Tax=Pecten maximus TaxID=6579 RepID=UPI001458D60C|nr:myeloid-derived growth factor homolog [Pecten maximus]